MGPQPVCTCTDLHMRCHTGAWKKVQNGEEAGSVFLSKRHLYMGDRVGLPELEGGLLEMSGGRAVGMCGTHGKGAATYLSISDT